MPWPAPGPAGSESAPGAPWVARRTSFRFDVARIGFWASIGFWAPSAVMAKPVMAAAEMSREREFGYLGEPAVELATLRRNASA